METLWDNLVCECGGIGFVQTVHIRWKPAGGSLPTPTGKYICSTCAKNVDILELIERKELAAKKLELQHLEARISESRQNVKEN